jgi:hypothetical protein
MSKRPDRNDWINPNIPGNPFLVNKNSNERKPDQKITITDQTPIQNRDDVDFLNPSKRPKSDIEQIPSKPPQNLIISQHIQKIRPPDPEPNVEPVNKQRTENRYFGPEEQISPLDYATKKQEYSVNTSIAYFPRSVVGSVENGHIS